MTRQPTPNEEAAARLADAILTLAAKPANLEALQDYLSQHFDTWGANWCRTPEDTAAAFEFFAKLEV